MPVFQTTEIMYDTLGTLFKSLMEDPGFGPKFKQEKINIHFIINDPSGEIWITPEEVICGSAALTSQVEMSLAGDTCHLFWQKKINLPIALAKGKIKAKGSMPKIMKLLPMLKPAYALYPDLAKSKGLPLD
jgi:hypothetical protein